MTSYELKRTSDSQFMFNLKAANNEVILTSERYKVKASAEAGIESVRANSALDERFERRTAIDNKPYFVLKAANGEVIGHSETYNTAAAMETGIRSVKTNGPIAKVVDNSVEVPAARTKPATAPQPGAPAPRAAAPMPGPSQQPAPPAPSPLAPPPAPPPPPQQQDWPSP